MAAKEDNDWLRVAADVLECGVIELGARAANRSFATLGGTSLRAVELAVLLARHCGRMVNVGALLGAAPLADVVAASDPITPSAGSDAERAGDGVAPARVQQAMLFSEQLYGGTAFHLLFSAEIRGLLEPARLRSALIRLTRRHAGLRTMFERGDDGALRRRVLAHWEPVVIEQSLPGADRDPVTTVHSVLERASAGLLRPYERPPMVFVLTRIDERRAVLSLLAHHAIVDGWSIGRLWRELAADYDGQPGVADPMPAPSMEPLIARESSAAVQRAVQRRAEDLAALPTTVSILSDRPRPARLSRDGTRLVFGLSEAARRSCETLADAAGLTRNMVLFAAWALVVARRSAMSEFVLGMVSAARTTRESLDVMGPCMKLLPVACRVPDAGPVINYLEAVSSSVRAALDATDVPFEDLVAALGAGGEDTRNPLVQIAFAAHDELVPEQLHAGGLTLAVREGHCGGTVYDAVLYVQRWGDAPRLALEYATAVLQGHEVAELANALDATLVELAAAPHGPIAAVRTMTPAQRSWLVAVGEGPAVNAEDGLWQRFEAVARRTPDAVAVRDADPSRVLTYRQLRRAAEAQSAALAAVGVGTGDCVALAVGRSARELLAILAVLRLGAAYTAIEPDLSEEAVRTVFELADVRAILGDDDRLPALGGLRLARSIPARPITDPWDAAAGEGTVPAAAPADPARIAYVGFTSGSTGIPKGTLVPHRGVVRLARDPQYLRPGVVDRFVRLAPLAFDASTLEIFAPLLAGGTVEVYAEEYVTPDGLAAFVRSRAITGLWLTAGLFRLVADYQPAAFREVRQVLTGGDVVPPAQVISVLRHCPGLRVTNGYGPTENTTFTTVYHVDDVVDVDDPLPIGTPIQGTGVVVLDAGGRPVPPGGIGELYTDGSGLALGYAGLPEETDRAFGRFIPGEDRRLYRTGDLVRWDGDGRLRFLGRNDRQVKIRGFRVELDAVSRVLRGCPGVRDAAVVPTGSGAGDRRLLAGIVADPDPARLDAVRAYAAEHLPRYALPSLWAVVDELPITRNGKLDAARLRELAVARGTAPEAHPHAGADPVEDAQGPDQTGDVAQTIARAWQDVLGSDRFGADDRFFDVGGDSLQLLRVAANLRRDLPGHDITIQDLYTCQTIRALSGRLRSRRKS